MIYSYFVACNVSSNSVQVIDESYYELRDQQGQQGGFSSGFVNGGDASISGGSSYSYESGGSSGGSSSR